MIQPSMWSTDTVDRFEGWEGVEVGMLGHQQARKGYVSKQWEETLVHVMGPNWKSGMKIGDSLSTPLLFLIFLIVDLKLAKGGFGGWEVRLSISLLRRSIEGSYETGLQRFTPTTLVLPK